MPSLSAHRALALAALSLAALVHMALSLAATCPCVLALISKEGGVAEKAVAERLQWQGRAVAERERYRQ